MRTVSEAALIPGQEIYCSLETVAGRISAAISGFYVWVGLMIQEGFNQFKDILDNLVTPIEILKNLTAETSQTQSISALAIEAIQ